METRIPLLSLEEEQQLFGPHDRHVKQLAKRLQVRVSSRGGTLRLQGPEDNVVPLSERLKGVLAQLRAGREMNPSTMQAALLGETSDGSQEDASAEPRRAQRGNMPEPRTPTQREYVDLMESKDLVFATVTGAIYFRIGSPLQFRFLNILKA